MHGTRRPHPGDGPHTAACELLRSAPDRGWPHQMAPRLALGSSSRSRIARAPPAAIGAHCVFDSGPRVGHLHELSAHSRLPREVLRSVGRYKRIHHGGHETPADGHIRSREVPVLSPITLTFTTAWRVLRSNRRCTPGLKLTS